MKSSVSTATGIVAGIGHCLQDTILKVCLTSHLSFSLTQIGFTNTATTSTIGINVCGAGHDEAATHEAATHEFVALFAQMELSHHIQMASNLFALCFGVESQYKHVSPILCPQIEIVCQHGNIGNIIGIKVSVTGHWGLPKRHLLTVPRLWQCLQSCRHVIEMTLHSNWESNGIWNHGKGDTGFHYWVGWTHR
jgi:hypothetical protein